MKKIAVATIVLVFSLGFASVPASVWGQGNQVVKTLGHSEVVDHDYFTAGNTVNLSGTVNGDAYVMGGTVFIDGVIKGDLLVAGGSVTITGSVGQDLRVLAGNVNLNGQVGKNMTLVAGNSSLGKQAAIAGSVNGLFGNFEYFGLANRLNLVGGAATINGNVEGDVTAKLGKLTFGDAGRVAGNLAYTARQEADFAPNATISGTTSFTHITASPQAPFPARAALVKLAAAWGAVRFTLSLVDFVSSLVIGYVMLYLFPRRVIYKVKLLHTQFWKLAGIGLFTAVVVPSVALLLALTTVGLPVAVLLFLLFALVMFFAKIWVAIFAGRYILLHVGMGERRGWALLIGLIGYFIVVNIPFVGWFSKLLVLFAGVGAEIIEKKDLYRTLRWKKVV